MNNTRDILSLDDIKKLVDAFYEKVRKDGLIGPIFDERIHNRWPQHLQKMYTFWQTVNSRLWTSLFLTTGKQITR